MTQDQIPEDVRRFILTSITSVPYLEAIVLLRSEPEKLWDTQSVAQRLYVSEKMASELLSELSEAGVILAAQQKASLYRYHPRSEELGKMLDQLAEIYAKNLVEVTRIIHSAMDKKAQQFADAFKWRKD